MVCDFDLLAKPLLLCYEYMVFELWLLLLFSFYSSVCFFAFIHIKAKNKMELDRLEEENWMKQQQQKKNQIQENIEIVCFNYIR